MIRLGIERESTDGFSDSLMRPATQWVNALVGDVKVGSTGFLVETVSEPVNLLADLGTSVVTVLTSTSD